MNILFIDNNEHKNIFFEDMMPILFPTSEQVFCTLDNWEKVFQETSFSLVIYFTDVIENTMKFITTSCVEEKIPFLCVVDDYTLEEFQLLLKNNVQGLIQTSTTSLKEIKEIMDLIMSGGFYLKPPAKQMNL